MNHVLRPDSTPAAPWPRASACLPPGPDLSPEDQARIWLESPTGLLDLCHRKYGNIFTLRLGGFGTMAIIADPEAVRGIFKAPPELYECRHFNDSYRYAMGDNALFVQDGDRHAALKRSLAPGLRADPGAQAAEIRRVAAAAIDDLDPGAPVRLRPLLHDVALRCLLRLVFGNRQEPCDQILTWFRASVWRDMRAWKPWTAQSRLHPKLRALLAAELELRRGAPAPAAPDLLHTLLAARDDAGRPLADAVIQDQVLMLMITAGDAVAVAASWALHRVAADPGLQDRLRAEAAALGPDPDPMELAAQPWLSATCREVLRLHTVLPTVSGRRLTAPITFMGHELEEGVTLAPCQHLVHRRADIFEDPVAFRPARFMDRTYAPHEYFPFGGGRRSCLGTHLAPLTIKLILTSFLSGGRVSEISSVPPRVVRYGTLLAPEDGFSLEFSRL